MSGSRVVIVGAGVIGTACAHYLRKSGWDVTLLDQGKVGGGCSHGNCGYVCPSHILPMAGPGMIGKTLKTLFQRNSPLRIKPRFDPVLWSWFFRFARRCNHRDMLNAGRGIQALLDSSRSLYDELLQCERLEVDWEERGLLFIFHSAAEMEHYATTDRLLRREFGLGARPYDGRQLVALEPSLKDGLGGAWHYENDAHLRPDKLMTSWKDRLVGMGVQIREDCAFTGFRKRGQSVVSVETSHGSIQADAVVIATGAWTPLLHRQLGIRVPIQPGKGYSLTMARPARCPKIPMIFEEHRVAVTPFPNGYRIGSTMEFAGYDSSMNPQRLELLRQGASHYLHEPTADPVLEQWWGWRPMIPDGKPIIGPTPSMPNVLIAAGHGMLGLSMAPSTGKLVAELLTGITPHIDPEAYCVERFR